MAAGRQLALLIGCSRYEHLGFLEAPGHDVEALKRVLEERGNYKCEIITEVYYTRTKERITRFIRELQNGDTGILFYSGHGLPAVGKSGMYLCTYESVADVPEAAGFSNEEFQGFLSGSKASALVVIIDSCHAGAIADIKSERELRHEFSVQGHGTVILAATDRRSTVPAQTKGSSLSPFTSLVVEGLRGAADKGLPYVTAQGLAKFLSEATEMRRELGLTPTFGGGGLNRGLIRIVKNPDADLDSFPEAIRPALESTDMYTRMGAYFHLGECARLDETLEGPARRLLDRYLQRERLRRPGTSDAIRNVCGWLDDVKELDGKRKRLAAVEACFTASQAERQRLQAALGEVEKEASDFRTKRKAYEDELLTVRTDLEDARSRASLAEKVRTDADEEREKAIAEAEKSETLRRRVEAQSRKEIGDLQARLTEFESELLVVRTDLQDAQSRAHEAETFRKQVDEERQRLAAKADEREALRRHAEALSVEAEAARLRAEAERDDANLHSAELRAQAAVAERAGEEARASRQLLETERDKFRAKLQQEVKRADAAEADLRDAGRELAVSRNSEKNLEAECEKIRSALAEVEGRLWKREEEAVEVRTGLLNLAAQTDDAGLGSESEKSALSAIEKRLRTAAQELDEARLNATVASNRFANAEAKQRELEAELVRAKDNVRGVESERAEIKANLARTIHSLQQTEAALAQSLAKGKVPRVWVSKLLFGFIALSAFLGLFLFSSYSRNTQLKLKYEIERTDLERQLAQSKEELLKVKKEAADAKEIATTEVGKLREELSKRPPAADRREIDGTVERLVDNILGRHFPGPGYDCSTRGDQVLSQFVCQRRDMWEDHLSLVNSYWSLWQDRGQSKEVEVESMKFLEGLISACLEGGADSEQKACLRKKYLERRVSIAQRLSAEALRDSQLTPEQAIDAQRLLKKKQYPVGRVDGSLGPASRAAVRKWQEDKGLRGNGLLSAEAIEVLRRDP